MFHNCLRVCKSFTYSARPSSSRRLFQSISNTDHSTKLQGKTIIVTGASRGIGLAIAQKYAHHQAKKIVLVGRHEGTLKQVTQEINASTETVGDNEHEYRVGDVGDRKFWEELGREWVSLLQVVGHAAGFLLYSVAKILFSIPRKKPPSS